eukprot:5032477-Amphidinium_carterae.2
MRRSIQSHLLATASAPKPVPMDLGYLPCSNKGKGKDGKDKGYKGGSKGKGDKGGWHNQQGGRGGKFKESRKTSVATAKVQARARTVEPPSTSQGTAGSAGRGATSRNTAVDR